MGKMMNKALNFMGFDAAEEYDEDDYYMESDGLQDHYEEPVMREEAFSTRRTSARSSRNVDQNTRQMKLVVMQPANFEEARDIANHLKAMKPIVMNLETLEKEVSRRIVDFLSGAVYALDGNIRKISNGIFLIAPNNVEIICDESGIKANGSFPWAN
ncbi:MAG: cell division protein SepF [Oscillospiraceae bacterium]